MLGACGPAPKENRALSSLAGRVAEIREAAAGRSRSDAQEKLDDLETEVNRLRSTGELTEAKANQILAAAREVERDLETVTASPSPSFRSPSPIRRSSPPPVIREEPPPASESPPPSPEPPPEPEPEESPPPQPDNQGNGQDGTAESE